MTLKKKCMKMKVGCSPPERRREEKHSVAKWPHQPILKKAAFGETSGFGKVLIVLIFDFS